MTISNDMAALVGFVCETFFYACYTMLFATAVYLKLNGPEDQRSVGKPLFIITVLLYMVCSTHFAVQFAHFYTALNNTGVKGFSNIANTLIVAAFLDSIAASMGELILIYRCWVLWSKNYWVILIPTLAAIGNLVCGCENTHLLLRVSHGAPLAAAALVPLGFVSFILLLCGNTIVTTLIIMRIWYLSPRRRNDVSGTNFPTGPGRAAIAITIESGMLNFVVQLITCVLYTMRHPGVGVVVGISVQTFGIAPTLIFIRMSGLLNAHRVQQSGLVPSRVVSTSLPMSTKLDSSHSTTTSSTDPSLAIGVHEPITQWESSGGDLVSNLSVVHGDTAV